MVANHVSDDYFSWLYGKIARGKKYTKLSSYLHNRWEFRWFVPNDDNRQADGYDLRYQFMTYLDENGKRPGQHEIDQLLEQPVSVFEVLIALTDRVDFQLFDPEIPPRNARWFEDMLFNLGIDALVDRVFTEEHEASVDRVIQNLLDRTYGEDGEGSLFPLENPREDMTRVEIWYQLMAYLLERYPELWM